MAEGFKCSSRRPPLLTCNGAISCDVPLAGQAGLDILRNGGNAADAAVAAAAALNVVLPTSTGIGGDSFCLFYDAKTKKVRGLNGSGRAPSGLTLEKVLSDGYGPDRPLPQTHGHTVTVPGAAAAWIDTVKEFGSGQLTMDQILRPAIKLAEAGFPATEVCSHWWKKEQHLLTTDRNVHGSALLIDGRAPRCGEVFRNPQLANTLKELAKNGKEGFYKGRIAQAISDAILRHDGVMSTDDLAAHVSTLVEPISVDYKGARLWEIPPSDQGIIALMALNIVENFDVKSMGLNSPTYIHTLTEALNLATCDAMRYIADPEKVKVPVKDLLSKERAKTRAGLISHNRVLNDIRPDVIDIGTDTTYLTVVDVHGNACSFINSNFMGFGTGIVPEGCGFTLQNRGSNFSLDASHPNVIAPNKRPFHTIIPAMITSDKSGDLLASYGVMGGYMQPQGHLQVFLNMVEFGMDPQRALDTPRIFTKDGLHLEDGIPDDVNAAVSALGHDAKKITGYDRAIFGRGHIITNGAWWSRDECQHDDKMTRVWWTGTDPRCDGLACGY